MVNRNDFVYSPLSWFEISFWDRNGKEGFRRLLVSRISYKVIQYDKPVITKKYEKRTTDLWLDIKKMNLVSLVLV